jgi:DNA-binding NarL/FixJ family response regulator
VPVNILIVDDSARIRSLIRSCIEQNSELKICGEAENGRVAIEKVRALNPDVVILDWLMPIMSGLEAAREITHLAPKTAMVMLTLHRSSELVKAAAAVGIHHVFSKSESLPDLIASLSSVSPERGVDVRQSLPPANTR